MGTKERSVELSLFFLLGSGTVGMRMLTGGMVVDVSAMVVSLTVSLSQGHFAGTILGVLSLSHGKSLSRASIIRSKLSLFSMRC